MTCPRSPGPIGNLIILGKDFKFEKTASIALEDNTDSELSGGITMIGYNATENVKRFHFDMEQKPVLVVEPGQSIGELESVPAIKRLNRQGKDND